MSQREIGNVYIIGLGAIGATYAARLVDYVPQKVKVICTAERLAAYQEKGLIVNGKAYQFSFILPEDQGFPPADLILIAVKHHQPDQAVENIKGFLGENTIVMSLLNGISSEEEIGNVIGMRRLL
jgi:2-dehydropantoate 2-reductase